MENETACFSETLVSTWCHSPEEQHQYVNRCEKLKYHSRIIIRNFEMRCRYYVNGIYENGLFCILSRTQHYSTLLLLVLSSGFM